MSRNLTSFAMSRPRPSRAARHLLQQVGALLEVQKEQALVPRDGLVVDNNGTKLFGELRSGQRTGAGSGFLAGAARCPSTFAQVRTRFKFPSSPGCPVASAVFS